MTASQLLDVGDVISTGGILEHRQTVQNGDGFIALRLVLAIVAGTVGSFLAFLVHKAAGPMFMGFLAVGSTWGIHQTIAEQFGMQWAATTVSLTAAVATLFALAGVKVR